MKLNFFIFAVLLSFGFANADHNFEVILPIQPDPELSVGVLCTESHVHFKEFRYSEQIPYCRRKVSRSKKRRVYEKYGIPKPCRRYYTVDHLIPLSIGGDNSMRNLWPEHKAIKRLRKDLEFDVFLELKAGHVTQKEAVRRILFEKNNPPLLRAEKNFNGCVRKPF